MDYSKLNLKIRSHTILCGMPLPLIVNIAQIKHATEEIIDYKITVTNSDLIIDYLSSPFKSEILYMALVKKIRKIWDCIDFDIAEESIIGKVNIKSFEEFEILCLHTDLCTLDQIFSTCEEILYYEEKLRKMFLNECVRMFDVEKQFPKIQMEEDSSTRYIQQYSKFFSYPEAMNGFQLVSEFPMQTWFPENNGVSFMEWSWRELECKRIYMSIKNATENFRELVKSKALEVSRTESSSKRR